LPAAEALKQIPGIVTRGKKLNYWEIHRAAMMGLRMEIILKHHASFHTIIRMSRAKVGR
jgi:hypothetical protein